MGALPVEDRASHMSDALSTQEGELRAKLGKLEMALSAIVDAIVWVREDGKVQWFNAPFRRLVGRQHEEILEAELIDLLPLEQDGRRLHPNVHPVALALNGKPNSVGIYEFRKGDQQIVLEVLAARVRFSKQEMSTVVAIRDITERKRAEERQQRLAAAASAAAAAAKKRAAELDKAYQELKTTQGMLIQAEKMAAIGQLASGIAHEVKNPLGVIMQGINYLELGVETSEEQTEVLSLIKEAVKRADKIARDVLNFSRPASLELKACAISQVLEDSLTLVQKQLAVKNIEVAKEIAPVLPVVMIDENQMKQVFINLIVNAFQAMPSGGRLSIRCYPKPLTERSHGIGRRVTDFFQPRETALVCEVEDTGIGIPQEKLARVFDPFFTTKPPGEGTGLGLTITRAIVDAHRGLIAIESEEGKGTRVTITLPIAK